MTIIRSIPKRFHPLLIGFILALVCHSLLLSFLQLRRSQRKVPEQLKSRDNTPELLQFSSQSVSTTNLEILPLPKARILPPPKVVVPTQKKPSGGRDKRQATKISKALPNKKASHPSERAPETLAQSSPNQSPKAPSPAVEEMQGLRERVSSTQGEDKQRQANGRPLSLEQQRLFNKLWSQAAPTSHRPGDGIQIRILPSKQHQQSGLHLHHRQVVIFDHTINLIWIEGDNLWILQAETAPGSLSPDSSYSESNSQGGVPIGR